MSSFDSYGEFKIIIARVEFNTLPYHICIIILIVNNIIPVHVHTCTWRRDLTVKRQLDNNPVLWELLLFVSEGGRETSSLSVCAPVVRALLTVLSQHWQRCCVNKTTMFPKELASSISLVECLARVRRPFLPHWEKLSF